jgi:DNA-binding HxlR family transcriptional regulator
MRHKQLIDQSCSIARPLAILGDRWTLVILRQAFMGVRRFEDFQSTLGISRSSLSERLERLVDYGVFRLEPYKDNRTRHQYRLTRKGHDLYPVLQALRAWGDKYMAGPEGEPWLFVHRDCGGSSQVEHRCSRCGEELRARDVEMKPGPGVLASISESEVSALVEEWVDAVGAGRSLGDLPDRAQSARAQGIGPP